MLNGKRRRLTTGDIDRVLAQADRSPDGSYRALASKALEGKPVGEFLYYGTRADDPNDIVAHENRRELRGMGVVAAWIDRVDAKAGNTLDTLVVDNGKEHHPTPRARLRIDARQRRDRAERVLGRLRVSLGRRATEKASGLGVSR